MTPVGQESPSGSVVIADDNAGFRCRTTPALSALSLVIKVSANGSASLVIRALVSAPGSEIMTVDATSLRLRSKSTSSWRSDARCSSRLSTTAPAETVASTVDRNTKVGGNPWIGPDAARDSIRFLTEPVKRCI